MAANPTARTGTLTATPGSGSASRAGPIGVSGDAATAMTHAPAAPAAAAAVTSARPAAISWRRVMPRAASVPLSWAAASSVRVATWPTISHAHSATASANSAERHRLRADRPLDRRRLRRLVGHEDLAAGGREAPGQGLRGRAVDAARDSPGRSVTYAPSNAW